MKHKYQILLLVCWIVYAGCAVIKLCGLDWFKAQIDNDTLLQISNYIDNNFIVKAILACINSLILSSLTVLAILQKKCFSKIQSFIFIPCIIAMSVVSWFNSMAQIVLNILCMIVLPLIFHARWYNVVLGNVLLIAFQLLSMYMKDVGQWNLNETNTITALLLQIDTYVMVIIYYLYANALKKGD